MTSATADPQLDDRVLILAPVGKDASLTCDVLSRAHLPGTSCDNAASLCKELTRGAAILMLTEEALEDAGIGELVDVLRTQPAWSDIPILLFADAERSELYLRTLRLLEGLRNVVLLERPIRLGAALSLIRSAIRSRQRQYELRNLLNALADAREEAERANSLKDEFLATLSHELRTPLNAILGWTTMLRDGNVQQRHITRALDTIHRNATAQVQIVNDLLDVSRIVRGTVQLAPRLIPLAPLLVLGLESMTPTAEAKGVHLAASIDPEPSHVWGDPDRLQQVFWNLLANALKFTPAGGRIEVELHRRGSGVCVSVSDTGSGISAAFLPHVFERFRQGDGSPTREHGGLGLGLSIVRQMVELHGGKLTADSPGPGLGATFTVYLPLRDGEPGPAPVPRMPDLSGSHILIVDSEPSVRESLRGLLSGTGARLSDAASAHDAMGVVGDDPPDILLAEHFIRAPSARFHVAFSKPIDVASVLGALERMWVGGGALTPDSDTDAQVH